MTRPNLSFTKKFTPSKFINLLILLKNSIWDIISFLILLITHLTALILIKISHFKYFPQIITNTISPFLNKIYQIICNHSRYQNDTISRLNLIDLALKNMMSKKTRTFITIGGMSIGIGAIVFLVSIGYGAQKLVISKVARLDEMRQTEITTQPGSKINISDASISNLKDIPKVENVLPLITVVGRINFKNSITDAAVYGVTQTYLKESAIKPIRGKIIENDDITNTTSSQKNESGQVAGASTSITHYQFNQKIQNIIFSLPPNIWYRIRQSPDSTSPIIGYARRVEGFQSGELTWGYPYSGGENSIGTDQNGKPLNHWIKSDFLAWNKNPCDPKESHTCQDSLYQPQTNQDNTQKQISGYIAILDISWTPEPSEKNPQVLGETTSLLEIDPNTLISSSSADLELAALASEAGIIKPPETKSISLSQKALKQAVINQALLKILGIPLDQAIGQTFQIKFIVTGELLSEQDLRIESNTAEYTIIGVVPEDNSPYLYVPFIDLRGLGIANYSQLKLITDKPSNLPQIRKQIEALGYVTTSVADTVNQIDQLFATVKTILAALGTVALSVAALGMFNTLTVSLLERTHEVGLMKAMGMKSHEIKDLFLTESMIMGIVGGILGILLGFLAGKLLGFLISIFALSQGLGYIDISYIPPMFILITIVLSIIVGIATGIYPARRATKISALNALRYE